MNKVTCVLHKSAHWDGEWELKLSPPLADATVAVAVAATASVTVFLILLIRRQTVGALLSRVRVIERRRRKKKTFHELEF